MQEGGDTRAVFERLSRGISAIEAGLQKILGTSDVFMRSEDFGMITCW